MSGSIMFLLSSVEDEVRDGVLIVPMIGGGDEVNEETGLIDDWHRNDTVGVIDDHYNNVLSITISTSIDLSIVIFVCSWVS